MTSLRIATWNINGLAPNKNEAELLMTQHNLDVLLISEAHCTASSSIKFKNYVCYVTTHPDGTGHAGTAIIVRKSIKHHPMPGYKTDHIQATTILIEDKSGCFNLSAIYCPPKHKIMGDMFIDFFQSLGNRFVVGGDWNAKCTYWGSRLTTTRGRQLKLCVDDCKLTTVSTGEPTYWPSDPNKIPDLLDFFILKGFSTHYIKSESCYDSSTDHTPVLLNLSTMVIEYTTPEKLSNKSTDWNSFRETLDEKIDLKVALKTPDDIENATRYITNLIQEACWVSTPEEESVKTRINYPLEVKKAVLEKRRLRRVWHQSRLEADKKALYRSAVQLKEILNNWHNKTLEDRLVTLTATAATNYSLWKFTKNYSRPQSFKPPIKTMNGWARTSQEKANAFAQHLESVFKPNADIDLVHEEHINEILLQDFQMLPPQRPVTVREVWRVISKLQDKKAPGYDLITKEILKQIPRKVVVFLTSLYNSILRVQYFPMAWKVSHIIMIHKMGKPPNEVSSYRPISLLPILSKVFEKLLKGRLVPILNDEKIIPDHQFGFRRNHGTVEQVHRVCEKIRKSLEEKLYCSSAFLDIQQAFDKVWHKGLLYKLKAALPHQYYCLLKSYLADRIFQVKEGDSLSRFCDISAGVPQGSVLGPLLYTIYTADLPEVNDVTTATFADDTAILASHTDRFVASQRLQKGLDKISTWLHKWRIRASANKSVHVTFTLRKGDCPPVHVNNAILPHQDNVRYLGMHLDRRLTWKHHIQTKRQELNIRYKNLHWLLGRNSKLSVDNKLLIYKVILKPVWLYGIELWGSACNSNISIIQRMQNCILRSISGVPWLVTNTEIHKELGMPTIMQEIVKFKQKHHERLEKHPNNLAAALKKRSYGKRLKRKDVI